MRDELLAVLGPSLVEELRGIAQNMRPIEHTVILTVPDRQFIKRITQPRISVVRYGEEQMVLRTAPVEYAYEEVDI